MKTYLVTGGAGFIGSNFVLYMMRKYKENIKLINIDSLTYAGNLENLKEIDRMDNYSFKKVDICNEFEINELFQKNRIDYVVNFAAESHVDRSIKDPGIFVKTNILGTQILLDSAKKHWGTNDGYKEGKKFLQVSTDEVYGSLGDTGYFTEKTPIDPHSPYSASKASADMIVSSYFDTFKLPMNITRCSNNYGSFQFPEKLIPLVINNALNGKDLPIYGDGLNVRDWLYVEDHCKAIDMVINNGKLGEVYNVGGHNEETNIDIIKSIIKSLKDLLGEDNRCEHISEKLIKFVEDRKGHDRRYAINPDKITKELGWYPETKFKDGIVKTIQWYLENIEWLDNVTSGDYSNYYEEMYKKNN